MHRPPLISTRLFTTLLSSLSTLAFVAATATAQDASPPAEATTTEAPAEAPAEDLLTTAQIEQLVAPVALYPDTLLVQVLVAATYPLDVVRAAQVVARTAELEDAARKEAIEAEGYDPSVEVLATAFPDVLTRMADNIDWTSTMGEAMLAQSEDVMDTVQVLRQQAIETGALVDSPEQEVTTETTVSSMGTPTETVVIQPADPEVVYVPQYDPNVVYDTSRYSVGDAVLTGAIAWGTFALIDNIFDDDDDWNDYWGCRNCGGWNGQPIIRDPDIDIDVDGNVNIGNTIKVDRDKIDIDRDNINIDRDKVDIDRDKVKNEIDRDKINIDRPEAGWKPDSKRQQEARDKLAEKTGKESARPLPALEPDRGDDLRKELSKRTGSEDISRPGNSDALRDAAVAAGAAGGALAGREALKRSSDHKDKQIKRPSDPKKPPRKADLSKPAAKPAAKPSAKPAKSKATAKKPVASKPVAKKPAAKKPTIKKPVQGQSKASLKKSAGGKRTKAASSRGKTARGKGRR